MRKNMSNRGNGGQTYLPTNKNIQIPLLQCEPLKQPNPPIAEPQLNEHFENQGYVAAEWSQHFLPGVSAEMLDWFWANLEKCYYLWAPGCHKSFEWLKSPSEYGFLHSVHKVSESMGPGVAPMGADGIILHRMGLEYFPFQEHLEHVIIEAILNDKGEIFNLGVHMWENVPGGCIHVTRGATNTRISKPPKFVIDFSKAEKQMDDLETEKQILPHPDYEAAQWPRFLPKLYEIWKDHPDPSQNVQCNLQVYERTGGLLAYCAENGPVIIHS